MTGIYFTTFPLKKIALLSLVKISDIHLVFQGWLGNFSSRRRLHFWPGHLWDFQPFKRPYTHLQVCLCNLKLKILTKSVQGSPVGDGGVQLVARQERGNDLLRPQLLLPVREPGLHHGAGRCPQILLPPVWPGTEVGQIANKCGHFYWAFFLGEESHMWPGGHRITFCRE